MRLKRERERGNCEDLIVDCVFDWDDPCEEILHQSSVYLQNAIGFFKFLYKVR